MAAIPRVRRTLLVAAATLVATVGLWGGAAPASSAATIDDVVGVRRGHDPHLLDRPGLEALVAEQRGVGEGVARVRVDRLDRRLTGREMVWM